MRPWRVVGLLCIFQSLLLNQHSRDNFICRQSSQSLIHTFSCAVLRRGKAYFVTILPCLCRFIFFTVFALTSSHPHREVHRCFRPVRLIVHLLLLSSTMITTVMLRRPLRGAAQTVGARTESSFIAVPSPPHPSALQGHRYASSSNSPSKPVSLPPTPPKTYSTHLPLYSWQKSLLTFGSSLAALVNPARGDMIATLSEVSGETHLPRLRDEMLEHDEGRRLLVDRPSINTRTVDMSYLETLQPGTLGNEYTKWLEWCRVGPDTRAKVRRL